MTQNKNSNVAFFILSIVFFMWGLLTSMNNILLPHIMTIFELNFTQATLIYLTFFGTYFVMSFPAGKVINSLGYKNGIIVGLVIAGYACTLFGPAASLKSYPLFLTALVILATGITVLQVAANPYVLLIGKPEDGSSNLNLKQAFNSLGQAIAPLIGTTLFLWIAGLTPEKLEMMSPQEYKSAEAMFVQLPYIGLATILFILALILTFSKLPSFHSNDEEPSVAGSKDFKWVLQFKHLYLGALAIFLYVGAEVTIGSYLVTYISSPDIAGIDFLKSTQLLSLYWGGAMVGRFIGYTALKKVDVGRALATCAILAILLICISVLTKGDIAVYSIIAVGLCNSIMFPSIFSLGLSGLGKFSEEGSSVLIMGIVGGAILPFIAGIGISSIGIHNIMILPAFCYLFIIYYGLKGSRYEKI